MFDSMELEEYRLFESLGTMYPHPILNQNNKEQFNDFLKTAFND